MKYTIEAIENAKPGMCWEEIRCQWTLGQAYLYSKEAGNDLPNFAEVIWDYDIEAILADCRKLGVKEFTISSTFSSLIETIAKFEELGCTLGRNCKGQRSATPTSEATSTPSSRLSR